MTDRQRAQSGAPWEDIVGYCRAVRVENRILVSGTTAVDGFGRVGPEGDAYGQTLRALENVRRALESLGATTADVVRTRMYVTDIARWAEYGEAHGLFFRNARPAATMVEVSRLIDPAMLVEIEAEAVVDEQG